MASSSTIMLIISIGTVDEINKNTTGGHTKFPRMIKYFIRKYKEYKHQKRIMKHMVESPYADNLYSRNWILQNYLDIMECFPETWTHIDNVDLFLLGTQMQSLDVPWEDSDDLKRMIEYFIVLGLIIRKDTYQIKKSNNNPFGKALRLA